MVSQSLRWLSFVFLLAHSHQETMSTTTVPTVNQSLKLATNVSESGRNTSNVEEEWRGNDFSDHSRPANNIYSVDLATLHKYRRNGFENSPNTEGSFKRYFNVPVFPHHPPTNYEFEKDFYHNHHQQREKNRYNDDIYPVRTQICGGQYLRDVNRFQNDASDLHTNQGIVQGWIGGKSQWRDKNNDINDDKRHESTAPTYVPITTATPKLPPSFSRYQENNSPDRINNNYNKAGYMPVRSRYDSEYGVRDSHQEYNNERNSPWTGPTYRNQNNRIIYYDFIDDLQKPRPGDFSSYYPREYERNCGFSGNVFVPCNPNDEFYINSKSPNRNPYDNPYNNFREYSRPMPAQSKSLNEDNAEPLFPDGHSGEETYHRFKNINRGQRRQNAAGYTGYVYSLDLPTARQQMPGSSPSIYMSHFPIARDNRKYYESSSKSSHFFTS